MRRHRWTALLLALLLLLVLAACCGDDGDTQPEELDEPPQVYLLTGEGRVGSFAEHYCWQVVAETPDDFDSAVATCGETEQPDFTTASYTPVSATAPLRVEMEEPLPNRITLALSTPDRIFAVASTDTSDPQSSTLEWIPEGAEPGDYILIALAYWWDVGGAVYYYPITLQ
jgi:hypothetical protein